MRYYGFTALVTTFICCVSAIFQDEAYNIDYQHALLGLPQAHTTFFHRPSSNSNGSLLYTLSDKAVVGAVNPRDGILVWRTSILDQPSDIPADAFLVAGERDGQIVAAFQEYVTAYEGSNGRQIWSHKFPSTSRAIDLKSVPARTEDPTTAQDVVVLEEEVAGLKTIKLLSGVDGVQKWGYSDSTTSSAETVYLAADSSSIYIVYRTSSSKVKVILLDASDGQAKNDYAIVGNGDIIVHSGNAMPFLVVTDASSGTVVFNVLGQSKTNTLTLQVARRAITDVILHAPKTSSARLDFLLEVQSLGSAWAEAYTIDKASAQAQQLYTLPVTTEPTAYAISSSGEKVFYTQMTTSQFVVYGSEKQTELTAFPRKQFGSGAAPVFMTAEVAQGATTAVRAAVLTPEGTWQLARNGDPQWRRFEALAYTTLAAFSDDVIDAALVQEIETGVASDPATAYVNRLYRHVKELVALAQVLMSLPNTLLDSHTETASRHKLIGSKSIIAATSQNFVFALDANSGSVRWFRNLGGTVKHEDSFRSISTESGRVTLYTSSGAVLVLNTSSGAQLDYLEGSLPVSKLIEIPGSPANTVVKIAEDGTPQTASDLAPSTPSEGSTIVTINNNGEATGWSVGTAVSKVWTLQPEAGSKITNVIARPHHDPVASIGEILADRSVQYKYISPNVVLLTATSPGVLILYLVDGVTGMTLYTVRHIDVSTVSPTPAILSENWFAYSYTSTSSSAGVSHHIIISELFESASPNDRPSHAPRTNSTFSAFTPSSISVPHVISQAYTLAEPLDSFAFTTTSQGITTQQLLAYLSSSHALIGIPRNLLNPHRPVDRDVNQHEAENMMMRYSTDLTLDPRFYLSHARDLVGIKKVLASPTLLESTSLVFAFGHDIFGTQVAPSMTFDVLGKNFSKTQLILTVVGLYLGVVAVRPIVRKKLVERGWM